jgi:DMSO/TMAO reductase YedYZ molybdopterin-dependent catalytic subunit
MHHIVGIAVTAEKTDRTPPARYAALAGLVAGGLGVGLSELLAGIFAGAPSLVLSIGSLVIALQPPGAKQWMVDLFGEADKLVLNVVVLVVALSGGAVLGVVARRWPRLASTGFAAVGLLGLISAIRDPLVDPVLATVTAGLASGVAILALSRLLRLAELREARTPPMLNFDRRRFLGTTIGLAAVAATSGAVGRLLLERRTAQQVAVPQVPAPGATAASIPAGAELDVAGISSLVTPNRTFYRIDTSLLVPRLDASTWSLAISGMVNNPYTLTYEQLLALPLVEQYVTIACVSNEVGGDLVGNALWRGARLRDVLDRAGVQTGATQVVGRSFDGWTAGFPTAWLANPEREALVAVAMNGETLPPSHGFPARLIVPGLYGYVSATKWLTEIELTTLEAFDAYWVPLGWAKEAPILTQSRIDVPRGGSSVPRGSVAVAGVAWAPDRGISAVEVQVDDGAWEAAELSTPISDATWVQWVYRWDATAGDHRLSVRATDGTGEVQTDRVTRPDPDGARGHHTIEVTVG